MGIFFVAAYLTWLAWSSHSMLGQPHKLTLLFLWPTAANAQGEGSRLYEWRTGSWEQCVGDGCGPGGVQVRKVWCVHREGWTTLRSKCLKAEIEGVLERPTVRRSCFQVCAEHRRLVEWQPGPWMECRPHQVPDLKSEYPDCGSQDGWPGWQRRMTGCVWRADGVPVPDEVCASFHERPLQRQQCSAPCPSDCVVSEFTPWSNCSHFCDSEDNSSTGFQIRTRAVLVPPTHGGAACQNLTEIQPCFSVSNCGLYSSNGSRVGDSSESFAYSLRVSRWSECMPMHPTARIQRKSRYLGQHDANVHGGTNNETDKVHVRGHPKSHHKSGRHSGRTHNRKRPSRHVRVGYRSRQVECVRSDGKIVPLLRCGSENPPTSSQACLLPRDCRVSAWSHWGACSRTCVETSLRSLSIPGFRERKRSMKVIPLGGAKACPTLFQRQNCTHKDNVGLPPCPWFAWQVAEWGECQPGALLSNGDRRTGLCGGGLRFREVYCIQVNTDVSDSHQMLLNEQGNFSTPATKTTDRPSFTATPGIADQRPVDDSLCRAQKPTEEELCSIPCPADCLVSEWSTWSFCVPQSCPTTILTQPGFKLRRRSVLVQQTEGGLDDCPYLAEAVSCINTTCVQWKPTKRAKCVAHKGSSCGSGFLQQKVTCVDDLGLEVPTTMCAEQVIPLQGKACFLPCPGQCVLAQWSPWTQCSLTCSDGENNGQQSRAREILAYPASGVADCPGSEALGEQRACAQHGCSIYHWDAGPWGLCASDSSSAVGNGNSAIRDVAGTETCRLHGIQSRKVICIRIGVGQVAPMNCPERLRPEPVKACTVPCRRDCMTTPFSEWSPCPDSCHNALHEKGHETQFRWRIVVWHPSGGGKECPSPLVEERPCKKVSTCHPFRWQTHRWRTCHLAPQAIHKGIEGDGETCGHGLQIRAISCRRGAGPSLDATECLVHAGPMPPLTQTCCVACRHDCTFTAWSRFSSCSGGCGMMRSRRRSLIGRSRRIDKCKDEKLYPLKETHQCHCQNFSTRPVGPWSDCLLPETISPSGAMLSPAERRASNDNLCGRGTRSRTLACFDIAGLLMPMAKCGPDHYAEEPCVVTCPLDCRLSEWSGWSPCSKTCGSGLRVRSKWLREMARGGGQPCPRLNATSQQAQVYEVVPCHASCQQYFWMTGPWFACNVTQPQESCNISNSSELQSRRVWCVVNKAEGPGQEVASSLCDSMLPPPVQRPCFHPCPDHCVLGEWEAWTSCTQPCNGSRFQRRTRSMLRPPDNGSSCPPTEEKRPCTFNYNCFHYHYNLTEWSTCQLSWRASCGPGIQTRLADCVRSDGCSVDLELCEQHGLDKLWRLTMPCTISCPLNCHLSAWESWSDCSHSCGIEGMMVRHRRVLKSNRANGRPCPEILQQRRPCPVQPCYHWHYGHWSACTLQPSQVQCGEGVRLRNVSCMMSDGVVGQASRIVEDKHCARRDNDPRAVTLSEQIPCTVPCAADCHLSKWSQWSKCQLPCTAGGALGLQGVQARSRARLGAISAQNTDDCPEQTWEARPCQDGKCFDYRWRSGPWVGTERTVWCQRSDGINVTGGCFPPAEPTKLRTCQPACTVPYSICLEGEHCVCEDGFLGVLSPGGVLEACMRGEESEGIFLGIPEGFGETTSQGQGAGVQKSWLMEPFDAEGKLKAWVYGIAVAGFVLFIFIISMTCLACKRLKAPLRKATKKTSPNRTASYDGDLDLRNWPSLLSPGCG